jgi:hypothetical protein
MNIPPFQQLTDTEQRVVLACMRFLRFGPDFDEVEYHTVLGVYPEQLDRIIDTWPNLDDSDHCSSEFLAINNCMALASRGWWLRQQQQRTQEWAQWFDVPCEEVDRIFHRWRELQNDPLDDADG